MELTLFTIQNISDAVLRGVYMQASPGEITGLAGESGAGKTTIVDLLVRIVELKSKSLSSTPKENNEVKQGEEGLSLSSSFGGGSILVGGVDIRELAPHDLRCKVGVVPQQPNLFRGTILENIR
jgi:ATP-binding cassette subfamily B multidrug efflux pump